MNNLENESPDILFKDDYYELVEKLVVDIVQIELIESLAKKYKAKNPSFLNKLLRAANLMALEECTKWHTDKMINDNESAILYEIISMEFQKNASVFEIQKALVNVSKIEYDNTEENSIYFKLPYVRLYLDVLLFIDQDKVKMEEEDSSAGLTVHEKLQLLELLISTKNLKVIKSNALLETTLSLILGIKKGALETPLKEHTKWFVPPAIDKITQEDLRVLKHRKNSLQKMSSILEKKGVKNNEITKMLKEQEDQFDLRINKLE
jgi:hypothetical protein